RQAGIPQPPTLFTARFETTIFCFYYGERPAMTRAPTVDEAELAVLPAPPGRPRSPEADRAIRDATVELLTRDGYANLTMSGVAAAAGVSTATLYRRWRSKLELLVRAALRGELRPGLDYDVVADLLYGPFYSRLLFTGQRIDLEMADQLADVVVRAIAAESPPAVRRGGATRRSSP